jgi:hypothetical protein
VLAFCHLQARGLSPSSNWGHGKADEMLGTLQRAWANPDIRITDRLVASVADRLRRAIDVRGDTGSMPAALSHAAPPPTMCSNATCRCTPRERRAPRAWGCSGRQGRQIKSMSGEPPEMNFSPHPPATNLPGTSQFHSAPESAGRPHERGVYVARRHFRVGNHGKGAALRRRWIIAV